MRAKLIALGVLLAAFLILVGVRSCQNGRAAQDAVASYQTAAKVDAKVSTKAEKRAVARHAAEVREDTAVSSALQGAPDWASQEVPADVLAALRQ